MKLKKIFLYSATMLLLVSCANEDKQGSSGYGAINVQVSADYKVVPATRSTAESASTIENPDVSEFALKLVSSDGILVVGSKSAKLSHAREKLPSDDLYYNKQIPTLSSQTDHKYYDRRISQVIS